MAAGGRTAAATTRTRVTAVSGYDYIHSAVDAYSRVAYSEILDAENAVFCSGFLDSSSPLVR